MRLKSLELHGYKTFASQILFEFAGMITAIVGPNGSGKSNVADSLRWVLGEQSYSLLRGKKTEDMIFSGSEFRPRAGMASVTVAFDNSTGWLPIDFGEVAITRRAYRDGQNEYLINGQRVRLKDITELLAQSGLAERTYTIIGQGVVDAALSLKADERRRLFEEAAGIGLYRARREEAQRRLETTRRNLERVQDILAELQPRLRSLERQAKRAQEYEQLRADLRILMREWYGYHWHQAQKELHDGREQARKQQVALERARQAYQQLDHNMLAARTNLQGLRTRLNEWHRQMALLHTQREELNTQRAVAEERMRSWLEQRQSTLTELDRTQEDLELNQERLRAAEDETVHLQAELDEARAQADSAMAALQGKQDERIQVGEGVQAARQGLEGLNRRQGEFQARLAERQAHVERQGQELRDLEADMEKAHLQLSLLKERLKTSETAHSQADEERKRVEDVLREARQRRLEAEVSRQELLEEQSARSTDLARLKAQLDVLEQAENALSGYARGAQALLTAARRGRLAGARGALSSFLEMPQELETAIAAALGEFVDALILDGEQGIEDGLAILQEESARGVLLPVNLITPPAGNIASDFGEGVIGVAWEIVNAPAELRPALDLLLGRTLVVRDRRVARRILRDRDGNESLRVVTLSGEVFHSSGPVLAGGEAAHSTLARPRQRKTLLEQIGAGERALSAQDERLRKAEEGLKDLQQQETRLQSELDTARELEAKTMAAVHQDGLAVESARRQIDWQIERQSSIRGAIKLASGEVGEITASLAQVEAQISQAREDVRHQESRLNELSLDEFQAQTAYWSTQVAVVGRAMADVQSRCGERAASVEQAQKAIEAIHRHLQGLDATLQSLDAEKAAEKQREAEVSAQIEELRLRIEPAEAELDQMEAEQDEMQKFDASARQEFSKAEHNHAQAKITLARRQEAVETWRRRIEEDFGLVAFEYSEEVSGPTPLPLGSLVEQLPRLKQISPELEDNLRRLRAQLRRMGAINPEAQAEYQEVKQRYEFMTEQVSDLQQAEEDVQEVIIELDELMQRELRRTFDAVAEEFSGMFKRLFGGGSARLLLTDPEDMISTGVDIEARLPGKRMQGLSLLSGGERSLTASALIFALLKISPTPFCLLDEVDAMLDEANVGRFRELLLELSEETQFIVVTHNRSTVQAADVIYGVTMGRDSTSQVISLKMDEVEKVVD